MKKILLAAAFLLFALSFASARTEISSIKFYQGSVEVQGTVSDSANLYVNVYTDSNEAVSDATAEFKVQGTRISETKTVNVLQGRNGNLEQFTVLPSQLKSLEKSKAYVAAVTLKNNTVYLHSSEKSFVVGKSAPASVPDLPLPLVLLILAGVLLVFKLKCKPT